jgi:hypothetical protein
MLSDKDLSTLHHLVPKLNSKQRAFVEKLMGQYLGSRHEMEKAMPHATWHERFVAMESDYRLARQAGRLLATYLPQTTPVRTAP